jgi:hypothetical protein
MLLCRDTYKSWSFVICWLATSVTNVTICSFSMGLTWTNRQMINSNNIFVKSEVLTAVDYDRLSFAEEMSWNLSLKFQ